MQVKILFEECFFNSKRRAIRYSVWTNPWREVRTWTETQCGIHVCTASTVVDVVNGNYYWYESLFQAPLLPLTTTFVACSMEQWESSGA